MKPAEFLAAFREDMRRLEDGQSPAGVTTCAKCSIPLQEAITGNRNIRAEAIGLTVETDKQVHVCSDCYFQAFGELLDKHPISAYRPGRRV